MPTYAYQFDFLLNQMRSASEGSLGGGTVTFYAAGTTTPKAVWTDRLMTQPTVGGILTPVTLSADGTTQIYGTGVYKIVIKDSTGVTVYTYDNINVVDPTYSDTVTADIANITSLRSDAQNQIDLKAEGTTTIGGQYIGRLLNTTGTSVTVSSTDGISGDYGSVVARATGVVDITATNYTNINGDLNFPTAGSRITGDFSSTSPRANRVAIQSSTTNAQTTLGLIPNGTSTVSSFALFNGSDPDNTSQLAMVVNTSAFHQIASAVTSATGVYKPLQITVDNTVAIYITASGTTTAGSAPQILIGASSTTDAVTKFQVVGTTKQSVYTVAALPVGTAGCRGFVSDSNATLAAGHGNVVAAGGANFCPVYHDGTNWRIG